MNRYRRSELNYNLASKIIPLGSQTFSKSVTQYPFGISPLYMEKAKGSKIWDVDGNEYIDLVNALASITIGYNDKAVNVAIKKQLKKGTIFSLPGILEYQVSELLVNLIPCAEMVRFGKNGSDVTSAAVRLARAYTNRDLVLVCGYHGWQDWYIGSTSKNKGVPKAVSDLTHSFKFNDIDSLKKLFLKFPGQIAAVILEPMNLEFPKEDFLKEIRELCNLHSSVLIFDETITGFRFSNGGAQKLFNVTPDLATFGKGIANGFPISALVGKREIMMEIENIFYSGTFAGELLSLAAAKVVLEMHLQDEVCKSLTSIGSELSGKIEKIIQDTNMEDILKITGHPTWRFLNWSGTSNVTSSELKTYFLQEIFKRGLLLIGTHNVSTALSSKDILFISDIYAEVLENMNELLLQNNLTQQLEVQPLKPLFKVR